MRWTFLALAFTLLAAQAGAAQAGDVRVGDIRVEQPWARASATRTAKAGAAYFTLVNLGAGPDRLVEAASPVADRAALHGHTMEEGVMRMRPVPAVEVGPGTPTVLRPGGLHVMLMGLEAPLAEGDSFPLTLVFEKAGAVEVEVEIRGPADMGPGATEGQGHGQD